MVEHADSLSKEDYYTLFVSDASTKDTGMENTCLATHPQLEVKTTLPKPQKYQACKTCPPKYRSKDFSDIEDSESNESYISDCPESKNVGVYIQQMRRTGERIKVRLAAIRDEYDEKIRDCTMRVDGMAMATQWVNSLNETALYQADHRSPKAKPPWRSQSLQTKIRKS
jgi:hypothetical protein